MLARELRKFIAFFGRRCGGLGGSGRVCSFMIAVTETKILKFYICYVFS